MADGRHVTDYRPSCEVNSSIRYLNGVTDSNQFRQFLINNSNRLMDMNRDFYWKKNNCESCKFIHPDPNHHDTYWAEYRRILYGEQTSNVDGVSYLKK